jgi:hypothetical protein
MAVSGLGWLLRGTQDQDATQLLLGLVLDVSQNALVRESAYESLLEIWHGFDVAHRWFLRVLEAQERVRATAERPRTDEAEAESEQLAGMVWRDYVDWDWVARLDKNAV